MKTPSPHRAQLGNAHNIRSNTEVHGLKGAVKKAKSQGIPFDTFYFVIFGKYPTPRANSNR